MKKLLGSLLLAVIVVLCVTLVACDNITRQLNTPTGLAINNDIASWNTVENANGYTVKVDAAEHTVTEGAAFNLGSLDLEAGTHKVSVKALGQISTADLLLYIDSDYCIEVDYVVANHPIAELVELEETTFDYNHEGYTLNFTGTGGYHAFVLAVNGKYVAGNMNSDIFINVNDLNAQWASSWDKTLTMIALKPGTYEVSIFDMQESDWYNKKTSDIVTSDKGLIKTITIVININPENVQLEQTTFDYNPEGYTLKFVGTGGYHAFVLAVNGKYVAGNMNSDSFINVNDLNAQWSTSWDKTLNMIALTPGTYVVSVYDMQESKWYNNNTSATVTSEDGLIKTITIVIN